MLFNSLQYLFFLPTIVGLYYLLNPKYRWILLLTASYYFYMCWRPEYIILIIGSTLVDYICGLKMGQATDRPSRRIYLIISLITNLGILFGFKYFNFFGASFNAFFEKFNILANVPYFNVLLPVGISFYTFQTLSYSIDVYRGQQKPVRHLGQFALYVAFFPQLVAGPIERSTRLIPQLQKAHDFNYDQLRSGLLLIGWGIFKKVVIADRAAVVVNSIYAQPGDHGSISLLMATYFFAFQIYCDFSGYSDIAIGSARLMGIDLMKNFRQPYLAKSVGEFWQRWHISLSTWFRDYLYIPLGGNRVATWKWYSNLMIVFVVSGLWHGANWTFVIWGALHGLYLVISLVTKKFRSHFVEHCGLDRVQWLHKGIQVFITFHLVILSWIFFRANSVQDAFYIVHKIIFFDFKFTGLGGGLQSTDFRILVFAICMVELAECLKQRVSLPQLVSKWPLMLRWPCYYAFILMIPFLGYFDQGIDFIYFQF